jgi:hypothetical protein
LPEFFIYEQANDPRLYISITSDASTEHNNLAPHNETLSHGKAKEFSANGLKVVSGGIVKKLLKDEDKDYVLVSAVASTFRKQHGQPLKTVLKKLNLSQKIPKFLQSCPGITTQKVNDQWVVKLEK